MRRILVDHARQRRALKRDQALARIDFDLASEKGVDPRLDLVALDEALVHLAAVAARSAKVVELRYFGGLPIAETATFLNVAPATVKRHWTFCARLAVSRFERACRLEDGSD